MECVLVVFPILLPDSRWLLQISLHQDEHYKTEVFPLLGSHPVQGALPLNKKKKIHFLNCAQVVEKLCTRTNFNVTTSKACSCQKGTEDFRTHLI